jgi:hypothetical protein
MKIKIKSGEKITAGEFLDRWKKGIAKVTPLQQVNNQLRSTWIIIIGIVAGIVISIMNIKTLWWLLIILVGALGNTLMQLLGLVQKRNMLKQLEGGL